MTSSNETTFTTYVVPDQRSPQGLVSPRSQTHWCKPQRSSLDLNCCFIAQASETFDLKYRLPLLCGYINDLVKVYLLVSISYDTKREQILTWIGKLTVGFITRKKVSCDLRVIRLFYLRSRLSKIKW